MAKKKKTDGNSAGKAPVRHDPRSVERTFRDMHALLAEQEFSTADEASKFMDQLLATTGGQIPRREAETPQMKAQDLVYDAYDANSRKKRIELAREALSLDPDCADAYSLLAEETAKTLEEQRDLYSRAVEAAERTLGPKYFSDPECVGHFWGILETRPYMRARSVLAKVLWELSQHDEAICHYQDLLRLNPNDNQGLRTDLLVRLVVKDRIEEAEALLERYSEDESSVMMYTYALIAFIKEGPSLRANARMRDAFEANVFVPVFLIGVKKLPKDIPEYHGFGDEDEAVVTIYEMAEIWTHIPESVEWLVHEFMKLGDELALAKLPRFRG